MCGVRSSSSSSHGPLVRPLEAASPALILPGRATTTTTGEPPARPVPPPAGVMIENGGSEFLRRPHYRGLGTGTRPGAPSARGGRVPGGPLGAPPPTCRARSAALGHSAARPVEEWTTGPVGVSARTAPRNVVRVSFNIVTAAKRTQEPHHPRGKTEK